MAHEDLTQLIQQKQMSVNQAINRIANERDKDLTQFQIPCDNCGTLVLANDSISPMLWLPFAGHRSVTGFQIMEANDTIPHQHFCCSIDCAEATLIKCLREHYSPEVEKRKNENIQRN